MKKILYILITVVLFSCDDYLDVTPKGLVIPKKTEDYRLLLDNVDTKDGLIASYDLSMMATDDVEIPDALGVVGLYQLPAFNAFKFEDHIFFPHEEDHSYQTLYKHVYIANTVLSEINDSEGNEDDKLTLAAEAKVHRAYAYLSLVNLYAKHYNPSTASDDDGVPLVLKPEFEDVNLTRASVEDVYVQVLKDLTEALTDLPNIAEVNIRPSKAAAYALLARTYLYQNNMDKALEYADLALTISNDLFDWIAFSGAPPEFPSNSDNPENILLKIVVRNGTSFPCIDPNLKALYNPFNMKIAKIVYPSIAFFGFPGSNIWSETVLTSESSTVGLTTPELYFIKAEAHARLGETQKAMDAVNIVRRKRIIASIDLVANTADEALSIVKLERRKELAFKGLRFFDIKRYNLFDGDDISITHTLLDETYHLNHGDNKWVFPIAEKYINLNPEINQNPR